MRYFKIPKAFVLVNALTGEPVFENGVPRAMKFSEYFRLLVTDPKLAESFDVFDRNDLRKKGTRPTEGAVVEFSDREHEAVLKAMKSGAAVSEHVNESAEDVMRAFADAPTKDPRAQLAQAAE